MTRPQIARDDYTDEAYGIMNSCMAPGDREHALVDAENRQLTSRGVPSVGVGHLPGDSPNAGEGNFSTWALDLNASQMPTGTPEERADAANTVAHEGEHLGQWYDMARLQAGLGRDPGAGPLADIPPEMAAQASLNPILQSDEHTARVEEYYESVYGAGGERRNQILGGYVEDETLQQTRSATRSEYCNLPEERDAWARGREVTQSYRDIEGLPTPPPGQDTSICDPDAFMY